MAYLDGFEYDIFISYTHADNEDGEWVSEFHRKLQRKLDTLMGGVKIWRDEKLGSSTVFDRKIEVCVKNSAILLAVVSGRYLDSTYCKKEREYFCREAEKNLGLAINDEQRIFTALIQDVSYESEIWPAELRGMTGRKFHDQDGWPLKQSTPEFDEQLKRLAKELERMLRALKKLKPLPPSQLPVRAEKNIKVFWARTSTLFETEPELLKSCLQPVDAESRITKLPIEILDFNRHESDAKSHDAQVTAALQQAQLAIHILNIDPGRKMEGNYEKTYIQRQVELGLLQATQNLKQLIWIPDDIDLETAKPESQRRFLNQIYNEERPPNSRIIRDYLEFQREVIETLKGVEQEKLNNGGGFFPDPSATLVNAHDKDDDEALELYRILKRKNIRPYYEAAPEESSPSEIDQAMLERMKSVSRLIVVFGIVDQEWVRYRLESLVKQALEKRCPIKSYNVYMVPPRTIDKDSQLLAEWFPMLRINALDKQNIA